MEVIGKNNNDYIVNDYVCHVCFPTFHTAKQYTAKLSRVSLISWASLVLGTISPDEALESVKVPSTVSPQS